MNERSTQSTGLHQKRPHPESSERPPVPIQIREGGQAPGELVVVPEAGDTGGRPSVRPRGWPREQWAADRMSSALEAVGERAQGAIDCLQHLQSELRSTLGDLQVALHEKTTVRARGLSRTALQLLDWIDASTQDLEGEVSSAAEGRTAVDLVELLPGLLAHLGSVAPDLSTALAPVVRGTSGGAGWGAAWGRPAEVREAIALVLQLAAERVGWCGRLHVEVGCRRGVTTVRVRGEGEPHAPRTAGLVDEVRDRVVQRLGGGIRPVGLAEDGDAIGGAAPSAQASPTGLELWLPSRP